MKDINLIQQEINETKELLSFIADNMTDYIKPHYLRLSKKLEDLRQELKTIENKDQLKINFGKEF